MEIEEQALADGFVLCLLGVHVDRGRNAVEYRLSLFDGGRKQEEIVRRGAFLGASSALLGGLRKRVLRVAAPPHVLAVYGRGWRELLDLVFVAHELETFRILDLAAAAAALGPRQLTASADIQAVARAYGVALSAATDSSLSPNHGDVLWTVVAEAGRNGLTWPEFLDLPATSRTPVSFQRYAFDEEWLVSLPEAPAVYVMRDRSNRVLYVGKAATLRRRIQDYFRSSRHVTNGVMRLREDVHSIDYHRVGSELEALLLENRLIREHRPEHNVQRRIAEGRSRYAAPLLPVIIFGSSAARRKAEVFLVAGDKPALQVRVDMRRPPRATLEQAVDFIAGRRHRYRRSACITNWGSEGAEICRRYFGRYRNNLRWTEVGPAIQAARLVDVMLRIVTEIAPRDPDPAEFRFSGEP
jgi:hypothetical protein